MSEKLSAKKCVPCEGGVPPLTPGAADELLKALDDNWAIDEGGKLIRREFRFSAFDKTMAFVNAVLL